MQVQRRKSKWMGWTTTLAMAAGVSFTFVDAGARQATAPVAGDQPAVDVRDRGLHADVAVRQEWTDENGQRVPGSPRPVTYRLEQAVTAAGWTTSLSLVERDQPAAGMTADALTPDDPFVVVRMVHDERQGLRLFNRRGGRVPLPDLADRRVFRETGEVPRSDHIDDVLHRAANASRGRTPGPAWASRLVVERSAAGVRTEALRAALGTPVDRVGGLDRYVAARPDAMAEVLVDPSAGLPVEINVVRGGSLAARTRFGYDAAPGDVLVRRRTLIERVASGGRGGRVVTDIELSNVEVTMGGVR
jgi:hypothetical protein